MLVILATFFHKSAIVMLIFGLLIDTKNNFIKWVGAGSVFFVAGFIFIFAYLGSNSFKAYFLEPSIHSDGGMIRVMMNVIPALILFLLRDKFAQFHDYRLWKHVAILSFLFIGTVSFLSTATDRFALYLLPISALIYSNFLFIFKAKFIDSLIYKNMIILYLFLQLFIWLNYSIHKSHWVPYKNLLF